MNYQLVITSEGLEPIRCFGQRFKEVGYPHTEIFFATTRLKGECYCRPPRAQRRNKTQEKVMAQVSKWMDDNLIARYDQSFFHAGSWDTEIILTFEIDFEDEGDAILFFMTFK